MATATERLWAAAAAQSIPEAVRLAHSIVDSVPVRGQVWRARWEDTIELVIVLGVTDTTVRAAPVTEDPDYADEATVILPAAECPLDVDLAVGLGLQCDLPTRVLDRALGTASPAWCEVALGDGDTTAARGTELVLGTDLRHLYRAQLKDNLALLASARWLPDGVGGLNAVLTSNSLGPQEIVDILDVGIPAVLSLLRGETPVTAEQAAILAGHIPLAVDEIMALNPVPPARMCGVVDLPRHRTQIDRLAAQRGISDVEAHRAAAYGSWALAARQTGVTDESVWEQRLQRYFAVVLDE